MPFGAEVGPEGTRFRLWAPGAERVVLLLEAPGLPAEVAARSEAGGWHRVEVEGARPGTRYRFRVDAQLEVPDPASRFQPEGVFGPSEVIDAAAFAWDDVGWRGRPWHEVVLCEVHLGAFSAEGDFDGARAHLDHLAELGITALELMPLADCPGRWGWGYDGVLPFAPAARHGRPEGLKRLVEAAHRRGLLVLLDVVYNHFGPEGNFLPRLAPAFFTARHATPWGAAIDFEGPESRHVRDFFVHNALYWLEEYRLDGLRLDAVHAIHDATQPHVLEEIAAAVHERFDGERHVHLVLENDRNEARWLEPRLRPGYAAQWNDDAHHALHVCLTGERDGYYADYADAPQRHLGRCLAEGFAWQGEPSPFRGGAPRGEPSADLPPTASVAFLQNHDQVGNRAFGERLVELAPPQALCAGAAVLLLAPWVPLLFMGEEWGAREHFAFFCDFGPELAQRVREGRRREFARFPAFRAESARERIPDPGDPRTFEAARLDWGALRGAGARQWLALYAELLGQRRREIAPRLAGMPGGGSRFEAPATGGLRVVWRLGDGSGLTLLANLSARAVPAPGPVPAGRLLFATPAGLDGSRAAGRLPAWTAAWFLDADPRS
jgi:maltooligosyltrehalose trehalohydrolase